MKINAMAPMRLIRCLAPKMADQVLRCAARNARCAVLACAKQ
jgi:hypothetical protein